MTQYTTIVHYTIWTEGHDVVWRQATLNFTPINVSQFFLLSSELWHIQLVGYWHSACLIHHTINAFKLKAIYIIASSWDANVCTYNCGATARRWCRIIYIVFKASKQCQQLYILWGIHYLLWRRRLLPVKRCSAVWWCAEQSGVFLCSVVEWGAVWRVSV